jgi:uncharacterized protein (DUF952 family)
VDAASGEPIYHIVPETELGRGIGGGAYTPARFAEDGFVHCAAGRDVVLAVADDYYADAEGPILLLRIDPARLAARVVFEAPAPIAGGGRSHLAPGARFPHVYGPIALSAVTGVGRLLRSGGRFVWPAEFTDWDAVLRSGGARSR